MNGLQLDFGEFVTSAGAEVIESHSNWNYSRSLLFSYAIPYLHFCLRVTEPIGKYFTGGVQVVNGWNNIEDNNSGKTIGVVGNFTGKKISWNNNYYTGPENPGTNKGFRNLYDTTVLLTPADAFNAYINFDYAQNTSYVGSKSSTAEWYGLAAAAKWQLNGKSALTPRLEFFNDRDGYRNRQSAKLSRNSRRPMNTNGWKACFPELSIVTTGLISSSMTVAPRRQPASTWIR